ncbi:MAG TPA: TonB-dependent receptor [Thermodesulfobacteriota bacterium]|nr:TonB-dependent receptor [Thermodesulfobacteriota bacterium]
MQVLQMFYKEKDLVVSATRNLKPVSQVAENMTVITAKEIENMNAHTVADVLNRIPGLFINYNQDFGAPSLLLIQGSEERHVLVVVDGIKWNFLNDGHAETNAIPVGIIERIEVIKGPASSSWGSALGGVINIITKDAGKTTRPSGSLSASYGERDTQDYKAQAAGLAGPVGYYLYAGHQESEGLRDGREFVEHYSLYSKFHLPISNKATTEFTLGYSEPEMKVGDFPSVDIAQRGGNRTFFATASLDASLSKELNFVLSFHEFKQKFSQKFNSLGLWGEPDFPDPPGTLLEHDIYDEETTGGDAKFTWTHGIHTAVLGGEFDHGQLDQTIKMPSYLTVKTHPGIDRWALYGNDTIVINRWSITPGIRYDRNNITGSFVSPSLGITYRVWQDSLLRASVARGFTIPPLSLLSGGTAFLDPNPGLNPEKIMSYQIGGETAALKYLWLKATLFRQEVKDTLTYVPPIIDPETGIIVKPPTIVNGKKVRRQGGELSLQTVSVYNFYFVGGFSYIHFSPPSESTGTQDLYSYSLGFRYDDNKSLYAELFGHYIWWNLGSDFGFMAKYDDFLWDLNLTKKILPQEKTLTELFLTAHNLFNGSQYFRGESKNPRRWVEAGIRIKFK